ncbi:hypothetical protein H072_4054 [Dactylellina haptotyla CBS 200.50]|uniref:Chromo domain-containing protein n=1 Tax=Dactylellina haptotyla (strain CBS 200.50) TaxID=1284197 RepID=S8AG17_DACHA|nr:hypothetical protein H072_4054 [Dactylellina haptotyla CBS 200.50]
MPFVATARRSASDVDDESEEEMKAHMARDPEEYEEEEEQAEEGGREEEEEEFTVEKIVDHKWEDGILKYKVKWKGYEKKADQTWEPEDTLEDVVALDEYLKAIGGRPAPNSAKRGRKSTGSATATPAAKKNRVKQDTTVAQLKEDDWDPPAGSWEEDVRMIETLERSGNEHICYVQWVNGKRTQHPLHVIYQRCPQKMLKFYESHLVFRDSAGTIKSSPK